MIAIGNNGARQVAGSSAQTIRKLKVYAFDPTYGRALGNHHTLTIPYEKLQKGPIGRLVEVDDRDMDGTLIHEPLDLDDPAILRSGGLEPSETDPRFHQQMAYAVAVHTIERFERALGRPIRWPMKPRVKGEPSRLLIHPHGMKEPNAYFALTGALVFGYFPNTSAAGGAVMPGQMVYTCLSYDVVAHQTVHGLLQTLMPAETLRLHPDGFAFAEGFCDLVTLLQHFEFDEALRETVQRTGGRIHEPFLSPDLSPGAASGATIGAERTMANPILGLAVQFGEATGRKGALRHALHAPPDPKEMQTEIEPHARGQILVSAVFDALFTVYSRRTEDLIRLAAPIGAPGALHPDLVNRLAHEAQKTARQLLTMCVRALDWCPPSDIRFGDFLRGLVSCTYDFIPDDRWGYRQALIDAFRIRGIRPPGAQSYAEEDLLICPPWKGASVANAGRRRKGRTRLTAASQASDVLAFADRHRARLRLDPKLPLSLRAPEVVPSRRVGPRERSRLEYAVTIVQRKSVAPRSGGEGEPVEVLGGVQLVLDENGVVKGAISRRIDRDMLRRARLVAKMADVDPADPAPPPADLKTLWGTARGHLPRAPERSLGVLAFDPTQRGMPVRTFNVVLPHETLQPGPVGSRLAVIDYDASNDVYYPSVDLERPECLANNGVPLSELDPRFHQQMVYAVASETIQRFEFALGKTIRWKWSRRGTRDPLRNRLRIFPHAFQEANAFYDADLGALVFGYFPASPDSSTDLPGQAVFTCLSHDIIAHETTHALLDNVHRYFLEPTGPDADAFHEAFADIIALFQHFSYESVLIDAIRRTRGRIHVGTFGPDVEPGSEGAVIQAELTSTNPLVELARQFGEAMGKRAALRSALGTPPGTNRLKEVMECHDRGAILVAAVFDAYFTVFHRRTRDLMRLGRGTAPSGELHPDLAQRLCREAVKTARHFVTICVRALDYMAPVDVRFGDFLRAMVTADADLVPDDSWGYRGALIAAFRSRGIVPGGATSYTEEGVRWPIASGKPLRCEGLAVGTRRQDPARNARALHAFAKKHLVELGLSADAPIQSHRFHLLSSQRVDPAGRLHELIAAQLLQQRTEYFVPGNEASDFKFRGGTTLILEADGTVRYCIPRSIDDDGRLARQSQFMRASLFGSAAAALTNVSLREATTIRLGALHRGY